MSLLWITAAVGEAPDPHEVHPNMTRYRSGGIGHLPGDEDRSVTGMVPLHVMERYREHNGNPYEDEGHSERDRQIVDGIRADLRSGKGLENPVMLEHDDVNHWGSLGEGNHRLAALREEGHTHVPVRVVSRTRDLQRRRAGKGAPLHLATDFSDGDYPYTPPDIHPHHFAELKP